ncbi:MAG: YjgP/YjgQ family permease [Chthoniobacterales bacterium]|nr:YjgP/YjgQ family permease [Chthoniobacterales bacterium]
MAYRAPRSLGGANVPFPMQILDRYILKRVLQPFLYCVGGFVAIWVVFDLSENAPAFLENKAPLSKLLEFYVLRVPEIILMSLPVGLLLAILYTFTQMSRRNEIISILGAGRSVVRLLMPLFLLGLLTTGLATALNYSAAPHAGAVKKEIIEEVSGGEDLDRKAIRGHLFRNREDRRFWHVARLNPSVERFSAVMIIQEDQAGHPRRNYYADKASYDHATKTWRLDKGKVVDFTPQGDVKEQRRFEILRLRNFSETPWRISSSVLEANFLSVPELREYLANNAHFTEGRLAAYRTQLAYRWALPWGCFLAVLIAAPLGIVYSRRGLLGGITMAIGLFFLLVLSSSVFLALGKGNRIDPVAAAWIPLVIFGAVGAVMLWMRSTNREVPNILS